MRPSDRALEALVLEGQHEMDTAADSLRLFGGPGGAAIAASIAEGSPMGTLRSIQRELNVGLAPTDPSSEPDPVTVHRRIQEDAQTARSLRTKMKQIALNAEMEIPYPDSAILLHALGRVAHKGKNLNGDKASWGLRLGARAMLRTYDIAQRVKGRR